LRPSLSSYLCCVLWGDNYTFLALLKRTWFFHNVRFRIVYWHPLSPFSLEVNFLRCPPSGFLRLLFWTSTWQPPFLYFPFRSIHRNSFPPRLLVTPYRSRLFSFRTSKLPLHRRHLRRAFCAAVSLTPDPTPLLPRPFDIGPSRTLDILPVVVDGQLGSNLLLSFSLPGTPL